MTDHRYTHGHGAGVLRSHRWRTAENSAAYLLPELQPGMAVLDVGCGPGTITADLAARVAPGSVVGLDASEEVVAMARAAYQDEGPGLEWKVGDALDLPFADRTFDVVHAHQILQHLSDPVAALAEMGRVVAVGGVVAGRDGDFGAMSWYPDEPALERWREVYRMVARTNGGEPDAGRHLLAWAHRAGFTDVSCSGSAWCYATPSERTWWSDLWAERISDSPLARRAVELGVADRDELVALAAGWRRWGSHPDGWFSVPCAEIRCRVHTGRETPGGR